MEFTEPALTLEQQIALLRERKLVIANEEYAIHTLQNIGFYRLALHYRILQQEPQKHEFIEGKTFEDAITLYNLDRELRMFLFNAIEMIEVGFKARINNTMSVTHGPWWFEDDTLFKNREHYHEAVEDIDNETKRSNEEFVKSHFVKYSNPSRLPSWKLLEILSLGTVSKIYMNLTDSIEKKEIAKSLELPNHLWLESWMMSIAVLRNLCAHHCRIWCKNFMYPPKIMQPTKRKWIEPFKTPVHNEYLYYQMCAVKYLVNAIQPDNILTDQLKNIVVNYQNKGINFTDIGMDEHWQNEKLWQ